MQPVQSTTAAPAAYATEEIASQPECWARAVDLAGRSGAVLPQAGERIAVIGCGTSWFMAQCYAVLRERAGHGETDAFASSEFPATRSYDRVVAISRSGTTTEVLELLDTLRGRVPTVGLVADPATPIADLADDLIVLDFADEHSVVQTRFATSVLALLRSHLGAAVDPAIADARRALERELPAGAVGRRQFTFLGTGWTVGLANEAALKMREASLSWTEAYPTMEYRHGPMSISDDTTLVWVLGEPPDGLVDQARATGAAVVSEPDVDPLAELIRIQRMAVRIGLNKGLDPDRPRNLTRSVVLSDTAS